MSLSGLEHKSYQHSAQFHHHVGGGSRTAATPVLQPAGGNRLAMPLGQNIPQRLWLKFTGRKPGRNKGPAASTEPMLPSRAAAASLAPQRFQRLQDANLTASAAIRRPRGVESTTPDLAMPRDFSNAELHRPLFAQIPLELLSSCAEIGRRRLVFVYAWLWFYAGRADNAFPSVSRLALECGMKERDIRAAIATLLGEGWIVKVGTGPRGTNLYRVRMETKRKRTRPKPLAAERKTAAPLPLGGRPSRGTPPSPLGASPWGAPLPPGGTPPQGDPINKPLNVEEENLEELTTTSNKNMLQRVANPSAAAPLVTTAGAVATDRQIVVTSDQNAAPQRHAEPAASDLGTPAEQTSFPRTQQRSPLPDCALPHRQLLVEWYTRRRQKHPDAPRELSAADQTAIQYSNALGVLQPFLEHAAATGCKSLATGYKRRCEQLRAGPAASAAFEKLCAVHLASPRRATSQSLPAAQRELAAVLAEGHTIDALVAAHGAELQAQEQQLAATGFAPSFPDLLRWLKERRFVAYLPKHQPASAVAAAAFVAPIDPETGASDPFAYHRLLTGQ